MVDVEYSESRVCCEPVIPNTRTSLLSVLLKDFLVGRAKRCFHLIACYQMTARPS